MTRTRREEIIDAALELFAVRGYQGASMDAIAQRVGLTRQGVLHYFPGKERLLVEVLGRREDFARERLRSAYAEEDLPAQMAQVVAHDHERAGLTQVYSVLLGESVTEGHPAQEYFRDHYATVRARMVDSFAERWGERLPSGLTPHAAATALLALLDGMQQQWLLDPEQDDHPEVMRDVLTVLLGADAGEGRGGAGAPEVAAAGVAAPEGPGTSVAERSAPAPSAPSPPNAPPTVPPPAPRAPHAPLPEPPAPEPPASDLPTPDAPAPERRRGVPLKGAVRRDQILRAALEVFAEPGTRGTLQEIANRVGVKQPSLLHYFASREELLVAVLRERGHPGVPSEDDPAAVVTAWVRHELDEPGLIRLLATLSAAATDPGHPAHDYFADRGQAVHASLARGLARAQRQNRVRDDERAEDIARLLPAVVDGLRTQWLLDPSVDMAALVETFLRLCADPGPPRD